MGASKAAALPLSFAGLTRASIFFARRWDRTESRATITLSLKHPHHKLEL